jgi:hypothetical protein
VGAAAVEADAVDADKTKHLRRIPTDKTVCAACSS